MKIVKSLLLGISPGGGTGGIDGDGGTEIIEGNGGISAEGTGIIEGAGLG